MEVTHYPDSDDIWDCATCGYSGPGSDFITDKKEIVWGEEHTKICECVFDIAMVAMEMVDFKQGCIDSRDLFQSVIVWAKEFEDGYVDQGEYMSDIEEFARRKVAEYVKLLPDEPPERVNEKATEKKILLATAETLAMELVQDLGNGGQTDGGDRWSRYFAIAKGYGEKLDKKVTVALIEEKHDLPENDWGYGLHLINDVDGTDCQLFHTNHLSEDELAVLLYDILKKLERGEM